MGLSSCCRVNSALLKAVEGWEVFSYSYGVWNSIQSQWKQSSGVEVCLFAQFVVVWCLVEEWMHSVKENCFGGCRINDYCGEMTFNHLHPELLCQQCQSFLKSTSIATPSLSDSALGAVNDGEHRYQLTTANNTNVCSSSMWNCTVWFTREFSFRQWYLWTEEGKSFSFLRIHHAPHTNEKFRVRFSSSLFCSNGNAIEAFKGFAPFWMEAGRQEGREREHDDDCGVEDGARKTRFRKIFMRSKEEKILQPHRKAYDKQFCYTNTGQGRRRGAIREAKLRTYLGKVPFKLINNEDCFFNGPI